MFQFETQIHKLRHQVLTAIAKLGKEDDLTKEAIEKIPYEIIPGDKAIYRCCVYKERAVLLERAERIAGVKENGEIPNLDTAEIKEDEQIIYILESACDRCPINEFTVTDLCRGCLAHRCKEACNFGAITYVNGMAYINHDLCKACGMCKKACQYDAISEVVRPCKTVCPTSALGFDRDNMKAEINEKMCVNCGACMVACPFGAISDKSLIASVANKLVEEKNMYAVVAPAITGQVDPNITYGQIRNAIKKLGFVDMIEAACGADAVTAHESEEFAERMENGDQYMTNSCCPGFLDYVEKSFPKQVNKISHTVSPMIAAGRLIKKEDPDAKVVFVGPCTAKKSEAAKPMLKDAIDYVLTFEELMALFDAFDVDMAMCSNEEVDEASIFGRGFGAAGGLAKAIENYVTEKGIGVEFKPVKVSGAKEIKKAMSMANVGKVNGNFIEGMMCEGGCINGSGKFFSGSRSKNTFDKKNAQASKKSVMSNKEIKRFEDVNLDRLK
jgi:[FeFe] hydrogenase (group B1/B3)